VIENGASLVIAPWHRTQVRILPPFLNVSRLFLCTDFVLFAKPTSHASLGCPSAPPWQLRGEPLIVITHFGIEIASFYRSSTLALSFSMASGTAWTTACAFLQLSLVSGVEFRWAGTSRQWSWSEDTEWTPTLYTTTGYPPPYFFSSIGGLFCCCLCSCSCFTPHNRFAAL
jgi:hypothetical protein